MTVCLVNERGEVIDRRVYVEAPKTIPVGARVVPAPPSGKCLWDGTKWSDPPAPPFTFEERLTALEQKQ